MSEHRLPKNIIPIRYDLRLEPNLAEQTFSGQEVVRLRVEESTTEILLNAAELEILSATIDDGRGPAHQGTITIDEPLERCTVAFATTLTPGEWLLRLTFTGILNDKLRGFYRSTYEDEQGNRHVLAATQFEATDARRAFPCWDEPDFKAVFAATLAIDKDLNTVSNTAVKSEEVIDGKKVVQFEDTIRMSTYLVAFIVGPLEPSETRMAGHTPLRIWSVPGKQHLTTFGLEITAFSLR